MKIKPPSYGQLPATSIPEVGDKGVPIPEQNQLPIEEEIVADSEPTSPISPDPLPADDVPPVGAGDVDKPRTITSPPRPTGQTPIKKYFLVPPKGMVCPQGHVEKQVPSKWAAYETPGETFIGSYDSEEQATSSLEDLGYRIG